MRPKNHGVPLEFFRWKLAKEFGWTLEYVDSLAMADFVEWMAIQDGEGNAKTSLIKPKPQQ